MFNPEETEYAGGLMLDDEGYTLCCGTDYTYTTTRNGLEANCADCGAGVEVG